MINVISTTDQEYLGKPLPNVITKYAEIGDHIILLFAHDVIVKYNNVIEFTKSRHNDLCYRCMSIAIYEGFNHKTIICEL